MAVVINSFRCFFALDVGDGENTFGTSMDLTLEVHTLLAIGSQ